MRILQISRQFLPSTGGVESVIDGLSRALIKRGYDSDVATLRSIFNLGVEAESESLVDGLQVYRMPHIGSRRYPIASEILSFTKDYDLLHIHAIDFFIDFLSLTQPLHRKPIIVNTHGGIFHTPWLLPLKKLYFNTITRWSLRRAEAVICVSQQDYDLFRTIVPEHKLHLIANGVNIEPYLTIEKHVTPGLLLGVGRVVEHKRIETLINLLPALAAEFPEVRLVWIGNDPQNRIPQLLEQARHLGVESRVQFTGHIPDAQIQDLFSQAHLFVSATAYEAFGLSTIEAMSSGTVPVVTPVGIHPEVIQQGQTGFLCDFTDQQQTLACFRQALLLDQTYLHQIGERARAIAQRYAWSKVVEAYLPVYEAVLSQRQHCLANSSLSVEAL
jgi:alpha-1,3-mannosyltransferase